MVKGMNIETGIDQDKLMRAGSFIQNKMDKPLPSHHMQIAYKGGDVT